MSTLSAFALHVAELRRLLADADRIAGEAVTNAAEIRQTVSAIRKLLDERSPLCGWVGAPTPTSDPHDPFRPNLGDLEWRYPRWLSNEIAAARPGWSVLRGGAERCGEREEGR